jgi:signal transduction histidine kinase
VISISDTGPGIQPEPAEKIFAAGFSTRAGGPGLGLAVSRKIVEQHGGELMAANRAGSGATFTLSLPLGSAHLGQELREDFQKDFQKDFQRDFPERMAG